MTSLLCDCFTRWQQLISIMSFISEIKRRKKNTCNIITYILLLLQEQLPPLLILHVPHFLSFLLCNYSTTHTTCRSPFTAYWPGSPRLNAFLLRRHDLSNFFFFFFFFCFLSSFFFFIFWSCFHFRPIK